MLERMFHLYQRRRVINVNVNIVFAGILAMALTLIPVYLTRVVGIEHPLAITVVAGVADLIFDVAIYFALHWVANHWRPLRRSMDEESVDPVRPTRSYLRDAGQIQLERAMISPIMYLIALGMKYTLLTYGVERELAFVASFGTAIATTRVIHTIIGLKTGSLRDVPHVAEPPPAVKAQAAPPAPADEAAA